ncbi:hypothetical protein SFRURICE_018150 [Spodoptera frugiperda]|nr:hypothetical protein SFRURICE_018150 [Spodoptera frugiperda]
MFEWAYSGANKAVPRNVGPECAYFLSTKRQIIETIVVVSICVYISIYLLAAPPSKTVTALFRIHLNLLNGPLLAFLFPETASRKIFAEAALYWIQHGMMFPAQVNLNHMLCPAILDPFDGPWYRVAAVTHQALLCPLLCKLFCLISDFCLTKFPPTKVKPHMKDSLMDSHAVPVTNPIEHHKD